MSCPHGSLPWDGVTGCSICARLATPVPASNVSEGLRAIPDRIDSYCSACGGDRWFVTADPDESGEPGEPYQVECLDSLHACAEQVRAALAHAAPEGLTCLDYAAHDWKSNGSPSFCGHCWVEWPRLEAARRRLSQPDATEEAGPRNDRASTFDRYAEPRDA